MIQAILALIFVVGLIGVIAILFKKSRFSEIFKLQSNNISIKEIFILDTKRKIVTVTRNNKNYTLLLGINDILLDIEEKGYITHTKAIKDIRDE